jgi:membrane-bound metal-dependent hydrolase YbcI (DUF457 family)
MFIGHYAVALAAKKVAPQTSLGTLFMASQLVDLLWPVFLLLGIEHVRIDPGNTAVTPLDFYDYPFTHSLLAALGWSLAFGILYFAIRRDRRASFVVGACVLSHWILDFLTHRPDLPLAPGSNALFGLGLWNSLVATILVEGGLFFVGVLVYTRVTIPTDKTGSVAFWSLVAFLVIIYASNILGPPPPGESAIAIVGNASWLFVFWAFWIDKHRKTTAASR